MTKQVVKITSLIGIIAIVFFSYSCKKEHSKNLRYFQVNSRDDVTEWRDTSFIIATGNAALLTQIEAQLTLPFAQRKMVGGKLVAGNGGYNKNAQHPFKWHIKENDWEFMDVSAEIFDGRPFNDIDNHINYWLDTVKRYAPWSYSIKKEVFK